MTTEQRKVFEAWVKEQKFTKEQIEWMENFTDDVSHEAYARGSDAEAYSNAVSYTGE